LRSDALQSRGRTKLGVRYDPGSAKHHAAKSGVLHRARETVLRHSGTRASRGPGIQRSFDYFWIPGSPAKGAGAPE